MMVGETVECPQCGRDAHKEIRPLEGTYRTFCIHCGYTETPEGAQRGQGTITVKSADSDVETIYPIEGKDIHVSAL